MEREICPPAKQIGPIPSAFALENIFPIVIELGADILVERARFLHVHIVKPCRFAVVSLEECSWDGAGWGHRLVGQ